MKSFDTRTYSINDFLEWNDNKQLELSPRFQRRSVWSDSARSYLMDTILTGKPIPKVFIRQKINPMTKKSVREVVDGQQRLRTILSFIKDGFKISKGHNKEFGGKYYSQLDYDTQTNLLNYELSVDLLVNMPDEEVLDVFARLNSYAVTLNIPEKINANHFGGFKLLADELAHKYFRFWTSNKLLSEQKVLRMEDSYLVADLLIAMLKGIDTKKSIPKYYDEFEKEFNYDIDEIELRFDNNIRKINDLFPDGIKSSNYKRIQVFYSLFTCIDYILNIENTSDYLLPINIPKTRSALDKVDYIFDIDDKSSLDKAAAQFLDDTRRATTDKAVRQRRNNYLVKAIKDEFK